MKLHKCWYDFSHLNDSMQLCIAIHSGLYLEFELNIHDYSLSEIGRLVESNDAKILHSDVESIPDSDKIKVTIKLNKSDLSRIIQTFNRFGYTITASFHKDVYEEDLKKRYEIIAN